MVMRQSGLSVRSSGTGIRTWAATVKPLRHVHVRAAGTATKRAAQTCGEPAQRPARSQTVSARGICNEVGSRTWIVALLPPITGNFAAFDTAACTDCANSTSEVPRRFSSTPLDDVRAVVVGREPSAHSAALGECGGSTMTSTCFSQAAAILNTCGACAGPSEAVVSALCAPPVTNGRTKW